MGLEPGSPPFTDLLGGWRHLASTGPLLKPRNSQDGLLPAAEQERAHLGGGEFFSQADCELMSQRSGRVFNAPDSATSLCRWEKIRHRESTDLPKARQLVWKNQEANSGPLAEGWLSGSWGSFPPEECGTAM